MPILGFARQEFWSNCQNYEERMQQLTSYLTNAPPSATMASAHVKIDHRYFGSVLPSR